MITTAIITLWGERVGAVAWDSITRMATFEYEPSFVRKSWDIAPLKMPLSGRRTLFSFPELIQSSTFNGMPGLLADVFPDRYGRELINVWLAQNGRAENSLTPVELLLFIGSRGMGALEFEPAQFSQGRGTFSVEIDSLVQVAQHVLQSREKFAANLHADEQKALMDILKIGTSAGGARPKAIIAYNQNTGEIRSGQAKAPKGFVHWLIKLDGVSDSQFGESSGYGRVEMAYYLMAKDCGIEMSESRLYEENGRAHFMTKRFDREDGYIKHHVQTLCAMQHYDFANITSYSYEQLFQTMRLLRLSYPDAEQMFRRMVFNVMARNCDDHTKNFAFILKQDEAWALAPAYDVCHSYRPGSDWVSQHCLSVNGKRTGIIKDDLMAVAKAMNIKKGESIINQINETVARWSDYAETVKVEPRLQHAIAKTLLHY
ncbi:type II toxin-antitoxin system HipA family toxin [Flavobacterium silvisoli]|uniref:Type II toxin-antitoxin system HipA family toxin n=1 Tax=Flavobacterium silvisoli TaxID=2529433 RepID=A0A4Q9YQ20_9FLAO|nr:type II toxin-antitoxin system HipA family toxin [Flavobacterium silvisoli]TBX65550.1 type II toxin-antitoxin system HipA family toxin [Flavobacterium silvisoli]